MKDTELIRTKNLVLLQLLIPLITLSVVNVTADSNYFRFISLDTIRVSREKVCLLSFDVVNCLLRKLAICFCKDTRVSPKVMASFLAFGGDLPYIAFIVLHSLEGSVLWSSVSTNCPCVSPVFICSSGDLAVHLLQGGRGGIARSDVVSCSHPFQYFHWNWFRINTVSSREYMS